MKIAGWIAAAAVTFSLQGCWFVFIPGSVVAAVSDGITGAKGEHCVGPNAKVGDTISLPYGGRGKVEHLSGTSVRCTNPAMPIRALLVADDSAALRTQPVATASPTPNTDFAPEDANGRPCVKTIYGKCQGDL